jgi:alkylhydroperoxidase family enzyme
MRPAFLRSIALPAALVVGFALHAAPKLPPLGPSEQSAEGRALAERFASVGMPNAVGTYLRYPELATAVLPYAEHLLTRSALPAREREIVWLRTAWLARSGYVWAARAAVARELGMSASELAAIAEGPRASAWQPFERALLQAADELHVDAFVSDTTWRTLAARYDENQLIDLLYGVGEITMHASVANTLGIELEAGTSERLPALPYAPAAARTNTRLIGGTPRIAPLPPAETANPGANVFRTFARDPPVDALRNAVGTHIRAATSLSPRQRQTVIMRIAVLARSEYEWAVHSRGGRQAGMSDADVARVIAGPTAPGGDPLETDLLQAADELYADNAIGDDTWAALAARLTERQLLDVLITAGGYLSAAYAINSAGVQLDANMTESRFPPELR